MDKRETMEATAGMAGMNNAELMQAFREYLDMLRWAVDEIEARIMEMAGEEEKL